MAALNRSVCGQTPCPLPLHAQGPLDPDFLQLLSHVVVGTILNKLLPFLYRKPCAPTMLGPLQLLNDR